MNKLIEKLERIKIEIKKLEILSLLSNKEDLSYLKHIFDTSSKIYIKDKIDYNILDNNIFEMELIIDEIYQKYTNIINSFIIVYLDKKRYQELVFINDYLKDIILETNNLLDIKNTIKDNITIIIKAFIDKLLKEINSFDKLYSINISDKYDINELDNILKCANYYEKTKSFSNKLKEELLRLEVISLINKVEV